MGHYLHNLVDGSDDMGKLCSAVLVKSKSSTLDPSNDLYSLLASHIAAMKPNYHSKDDIPESVKSEYISEGGNKSLKKMIKKEVLFE